MERHELADLLIKLAEGRADLEQALDELNDEQRGLRDENAKIHEAIGVVHAGYTGPSATADWQFFESPRDVFGRLWEQAQPRASSTTFSDTVSVTSPTELGKQFVEQWQQLGQQVASRFGTSVFQASQSEQPPAHVSQDDLKLARLVLDEVYRRVGTDVQAAEHTEPQQEQEPVTGTAGAAIEQSQPPQQTGSLYSLWTLPTQWQDLGKRVADKLYGRSGEASANAEEASATSACREKPLERVVLDSLYTRISQRSPQGVQAEPQDKAHETAVKSAASQQNGITNALWAVTLHWQHFGAPDRADPGPASPKLSSSHGGSTLEPVSSSDGCEPLGRVVLRHVYRRVGQKSEAVHLPALELPEKACVEEATEPSSSTVAEDSPDESPREFGLDTSPQRLGQQWVDQWQLWGKKVNDQLSDYVAQSSLGWETFRQALVESDLQKKKKVKKAKKEKALQAEEEAGISFSRVVLKAQIRLGDGSMETLDVRTHEQCKEVVSRFVKQHYLDSCVKKPLKAYLKNALNSATSLPVMLEVDLKDIEDFAH